MKRLYLMRHGQTLFNARGKIQGACDSPLTMAGIHQAQVAKNYFEKEQIRLDACFASTQERAVDTAEIICSYVPIQRLKGIKEWDFGLFEGESEQLNPPSKPGETSYGDYFVAYGGESSVEVQKRMDHTLKQLMETEGERFLAVSHGGAMYMFVQQWLPFEEVKTIAFKNCCILVFDYDVISQTFTFIEAINHRF